MKNRLGRVVTTLKDGWTFEPGELKAVAYDEEGTWPKRP